MPTMNTGESFLPVKCDDRRIPRSVGGKGFRQRDDIKDHNL